MTNESALVPKPLRFVIHDVDDRDTVLCCPVCACDFVHPSLVRVEQGQTETLVTRETTRVLGTDRGLLHRGSRTTLEFWCENGHSFAYELQFHKGRTQCELSMRRLETNESRDELWRN
jgi:hypothetical protein